MLSNCKVALDSGRFTWRHNCIINYIVNSVDEQYTTYSDLPGHTAPGGGSIPPELCVTPLKPDIVIIDNHKETIHLYELTCPAEKNIEARHTEETNIYSHFFHRYHKIGFHKRGVGWWVTVVNKIGVPAMGEGWSVGGG